MTIHPLTNLDQVVAMRGQLRQFFDPPRDLHGFKSLPTTPLPRVIVMRGVKQPTPYPMWQDIEATMAANGKDYARFEGVILLNGIGLGYLAEAIVSKMGPFATLAIWEPDPEWIRAACYLRDNTKLLTNPQVQLVIGDERALRGYIDLVYSQLTPTVTTVIDSCLSDLYPERRAMFDGQLSDVVKAQEGNRSTLTAFGERFFTNTIKALPAWPTSRPIAALKDVAQGIPAIVLGAGPGLNRHIDTLKTLNDSPSQQSYLILAADTALSVLLQHHIVPDFVFSVDPQEDTALKYTVGQIPGGMSLIYHPATHYSIPLNFPGPKYVCSSPVPPLQYFKSILADCDVGNAIQCQVHLACDIAQYMGCSPMILAGIDLCYYDKDHLYAKMPAHITEENANEILFNRGTDTKDVNGATVRIISQFDQYRAGFASRGTQMTIFNGNEQGLEIPNVPNRPLAELIQEYAGTRWVNWPKALNAAYATHHPPNPAAINEILRKLIKEWRFFWLIAKNVVKCVNGERDERNLDLVNRWTTKLTKRMDALDSLIVLERYGHVLPVPIRRFRLPSLADRMEAEAEWIKAKHYYEWLCYAAELAVREGEDVSKKLMVMST